MDSAAFPFADQSVKSRSIYGWRNINGEERELGKPLDDALKRLQCIYKRVDIELCRVHRPCYRVARLRIVFQPLTRRPRFSAPARFSTSRRIGEAHLLHTIRDETMMLFLRYRA